MPKIFGVNLAGAEFNANVEGVLGTDYQYPGEAQYAYYASQGIKVVRIPLLAERVQPGRWYEFDALLMHRGLYTSLDLAQKHGIMAILEPHQYGEFFGEKVSADAFDIDTVLDWWEKFTEHTTPHDAVYGYEVFCNEPHDQPGDPDTTWKINKVVAEAVRKRTGKAIILATPGWQSARFSQDNEKGIVLPNIDNYYFGYHVYGDGNSTGTYNTQFSQDVDQASWVPQGSSPIMVGPTTMSDRLMFGVRFAQKYGRQIFVTEAGVPRSPDWQPMWQDFLHTCSITPEVLGVFAWAGGPMWPATYPLNLEPLSGVTAPQLQAMRQYI